MNAEQIKQVEALKEMLANDPDVQEDARHCEWHVENNRPFDGKSCPFACKADDPSIVLKDYL